MSQLDAIIDKHFPFKTYNKGQKEAIRFAVESLQKGVKHVILELPTGLGKSSIATTIHRVLGDLNPGYRTNIVTATNGLLDQYLQDDKKVIPIKGKTNYACHHGATYGNQKCMETVVRGNCIAQTSCPYVKARNFWAFHADMRITNTAFVIKAPVALVGGEFGGKSTRANLTIIDECHEIDDKLVDSARFLLTSESVTSDTPKLSAKVANHVLSFIGEFDDYDQGTAITLSPSTIERLESILGVLEARSDHVKTMQSTETSTEKKAALQVMLDLLDEYHSRFSNLKNPGEWIIEQYATFNTIELVPVSASQVANGSLYTKSDQFVHMSATICGFDQYMKVMGIDPKEAVIMAADNPIPLEQRTFYALNAMKVSGQYSAEKLSTIVDAIISQHKGQNGIVHTVSFKLAKDIRDNSTKKPVMVISNDREEILKHLKTPKGNVILSPSIEIGYDFKGDLARWQILAKVPYEYLGSNYVRINSERDREWYTRKAVVRLVQSAGRSIRGIDDWATTYMIDSNFMMLWNQNRDLFPKWFVDSVRFD